MADEKGKEDPPEKQPPEEPKKKATPAKPAGILPGIEPVLRSLAVDQSLYDSPLLKNLLGPDPILSLSGVESLSTSDATFLTRLTAKSEREEDLEQKIAGLKRQLNEQTKELRKKEATKEATEEDSKKLRATLTALKTEMGLQFILHRISDDAKQVFLESPEFQKEFLSDKKSQAYVMAVDLRRSTDLMLKARKPELFARFITGLCDALRTVILTEQGVFDKFTGDGILAFFPDFYSGPDAGFRVVRAGDKCHRVFDEHYKDHRTSFHAVLKDVGLGIGIDYGETNLVRIGQELTVVGTPVVYSCRMAGARPGVTLLNQAAYEEIFEKFSAYCSFEEAELDVKHEGIHLSYEVKLNGKAYSPAPPGWRQFAKPTE